MWVYKILPLTSIRRFDIVELLSFINRWKLSKSCILFFKHLLKSTELLMSSFFSSCEDYKNVPGNVSIFILLKCFLHFVFTWTVAPAFFPPPEISYSFLVLHLPFYATISFSNTIRPKYSILLDSKVYKWASWGLWGVYHNGGNPKLWRERR